MNLHPTYRIFVGDYYFHYAHLVRIFKSRKTLSSTATIQLPAMYRDKKLFELLKVGDPVEIYLAYNYDFKKQPDFKGYISQPISLGFPLKITCKDEMFQLERKKPTQATLKDTTLKNVLAYLVPGMQTEVPQITIKEFVVKERVSVAKHLEQIKAAYGLDIYFRKGVLFAGLAYTDPEVVATRPVIFHLQRNVVSNALKYTTKDDVRMKLKIVSLLPDNTKVEYETGDDDGELRTIHEYNLSKEAIKIIAEEKLGQMRYDGYTGAIKAFGLPRIEPGMVADITDGRYGISGKFFSDSVTTTSGYNYGYRQDIKIGRLAG